MRGQYAKARRCVHGQYIAGAQQSFQSGIHVAAKNLLKISKCALFQVDRCKFLMTKFEKFRSRNKVSIQFGIVSHTCYKSKIHIIMASRKLNLYARCIAYDNKTSLFRYNTFLFVTYSFYRFLSSGTQVIAQSSPVHIRGFKSHKLHKFYKLGYFQPGPSI